MADETSDTSENEENAATLSDEHARANEAETPLEQSSDAEGAASENAQGVTAEFAQAGNGDTTVETEVTRELTSEEIARGTVRKKDGSLLHIGTGQISMGDAFGQLMLVLSALFSGEWEDFAMFTEMFFPESVYTDPNERQERSQNLYDVVTDPSHPARNMAPADFISSYFGDDKIRALLDHIARHESVQGSYDSVWPNSIKDGLTDMTINEVIEWQRTCTDQGSCAAGRYQFMPDTLRGLVANMADIDGTERFSPEIQDRLAIELMREKGLDRIITGEGSVNNFVDGLAEIWQALKNTQGQGPIDNALGRATVDAADTIRVVTPLLGSNPTLKQ